MDETLKPIDYASILSAMEAQRAALDVAIPTMRVLVSLSGAYVPEGTARAAFNQAPPLIAPGEVPPGSFHAMSIPKAAVLYLRMVKQKQKASEIATALRRGGVETKSSDFNNQIHAALDRASKSENAEIMKLHDAYWALREWMPANVRASMAAAPPAKKNNKRNNKKRKAAPVTIEGKVEGPKPKSEPKSATHATVPSPSNEHKVPKPDSTEGRMLAAMRQNTAKAWTAQEVANAAAIPRVQTAHFLLGKMAFRGLVQKTEDGSFQIQ